MFSVKYPEFRLSLYWACTMLSIHYTNYIICVNSQVHCTGTMWISNLIRPGFSQPKTSQNSSLQHCILWTWREKERRLQQTPELYTISNKQKTTTHDVYTEKGGTMYSRDDLTLRLNMHFAYLARDLQAQNIYNSSNLLTLHGMIHT